jgi:hypothetical protein
MTTKNQTNSEQGESDLLENVGIFDQLEKEASKSSVAFALLRLMKKERSFIQGRVDEDEVIKFYEKTINEMGGEPH